MKVTVQNIIAGKIVDGNVQAIDSITSDSVDFSFNEKQKTMRVNLNAIVDFDALEFSLKFDSLSGLTVSPPEFSLDADEFDLLSRDDTFKNEYWISITEKNPGEHDMLGTYSVLVIQLERLHGDIHIYITVE